MAPERGDARLWHAAFAAVAPVACVIDHRFRIEAATQRFADGAGCDLPTLQGRLYSEVLDMGRGADPVPASFADGVGRSAEAFYLRTASPQSLTTHPFDDERGGRHAVLMLTDSTAAERRQLLQAARLADIGVLAGGFAHEINSPLAAIALRAESLLGASKAPELHAVSAFARFPRSLQSILDDVFRCKAIVGALLDYARTRPQELHPVDLNEVAEQSAGVLRHTASVAGVEIDVQRSDASAHVLGDERQLRQAAVAVARNAIEASPRGARVRLSVWAEDDRVSLRVRDQGPGIPDDVRSRIFVPFFTTKAAGDGMGLGLPLCASTVAAHGGEVHVTSPAEGGTEMILAFPRRKMA